MALKYAYGKTGLKTSKRSHSKSLVVHVKQSLSRLKRKLKTQSSGLGTQE